MLDRKAVGAHERIVIGGSEVRYPSVNEIMMIHARVQARLSMEGLLKVVEEVEVDGFRVIGIRRAG